LPEQRLPRFAALLTAEKRVANGAFVFSSSAEAIRFALRYRFQLQGLPVNRSYDGAMGRLAYDDEKRTKLLSLPLSGMEYDPLHEHATLPSVWNLSPASANDGIGGRYERRRRFLLGN
jgi:hypothetical protein